jgi:metallophosphoesterase superfamily enzyme
MPLGLCCGVVDALAPRLPRYALVINGDLEHEFPPVERRLIGEL